MAIARRGLKVKVVGQGQRQGHAVRLMRSVRARSRAVFSSESVLKQCFDTVGFARQEEHPARKTIQSKNEQVLIIFDAQNPDEICDTSHLNLCT